MKMSGRRSKCPYFVSDTGPVDHDCRIGLSQKKRESVCVFSGMGVWAERMVESCDKICSMQYICSVFYMWYEKLR